MFEGFLEPERLGQPHHQGTHLHLWRVLQDLHLIRGEGPTHGGEPQERKDVVRAGQTIGGRMAEEDGQERERQMSTRRLGRSMGGLHHRQE